jgi:nucleoside-diphosphate-sugar epimerase
MKIFCTGASGYIGGSVAAHLIAAGHQVTGLVRSPEKAEAVRARGIQPVLGTLDDSETLARAARAADIVVNAASADHKGAVVRAAGCSRRHRQAVHPHIGIEHRRHARQRRAVGCDLRRRHADHAIACACGAGRAERVHSLLPREGLPPVIICPSLIYGAGLGANPHSVQVPLLIRLAKKRGNAAHAGPGENVWSNVHIDDLVTLYALAIEKAPAGSFYFVENGENSMREACEAINRMLVLPDRPRRCRWPKPPPNGAKGRRRIRWRRTAGCGRSARGCLAGSRTRAD